MKRARIRAKAKDCRSVLFFIFTLFLTLLPVHMFDFQQLDVYKRAKAFHVEIQQIISLNPLHRSVSDQLYRASLSIPINIAEGSGRFSRSDRRNFFIIARSSIFETIAILDILFDSNIISEQQFDSLLNKAEELSKILFAMIKNLEK
jgi:four helix bundle protein